MVILSGKEVQGVLKISCRCTRSVIDVSTAVCGIVYEMSPVQRGKTSQEQPRKFKTPRNPGYVRTI